LLFSSFVIWDWDIKKQKILKDLLFQIASSD
jgi:hypothetical protein